MVTAKYLLDTNVLSEIVRPAPDSAVVRRFEAEQDSLATAAVVWHELKFGSARLPQSRKRRFIEEFLATVYVNISILPYTAAAAEWHATERARLADLGRTPPFADGQIAAITAVNQLILVTRNIADFGMYEGLRVENWFEG